MEHSPFQFLADGFGLFTTAFPEFFLILEVKVLTATPKI